MTTHSVHDSPQVWLAGCADISRRLEAALASQNITASASPTPSPGIVVSLIACGHMLAELAACCDTAFQTAPSATRIALLPEASPKAALAAFRAGADDYVVLHADLDRSIAAILHHVHLILSRQRTVSGASAPVHVLPDPIIAQPAAPDPSRADTTDLTCVVSTRGRMLSWSGSMGPFVAAAAPGASFFELMRPEERPSLRNAALLLMAGEAAVNISARLVGTDKPMNWHLMIHARGDRFIAIGTPITSLSDT